MAFIGELRFEASFAICHIIEAHARCTTPSKHESSVEKYFRTNVAQSFKNTNQSQSVTSSQKHKYQGAL